MKNCPYCGKVNEDLDQTCRFCGSNLEKTTATRRLRIPKIEPGNILAGRYRILTEVGKGGMGFVYAAEEESLGIKRNVAIKVLPPQMMMDEGLMARFREEIKIAAALDHPNIVPIYSLGEHQGVYFYVMKLLDGQTATQKMRQDGLFTEDELRRTIAPIARALHYAHTKGVIHRDVKSNNIHISYDDTVMLMDFGIARSAESSEITLPGQIVGTAEYMSPEQWYGEVDPRSDIYSLGVVMYELLTGKVPYKSKNAFEVMKMHQEFAPEPPSSLVPNLGTELTSIILRCLEKDPARRFQTAKDLADALEARTPYETPAPTKERTIPRPPSNETIESLTAVKTTVLEKPPKMLTGSEKKAWELCAKADQAYEHGQLTKAIAFVQKAKKLTKERPDVIQREKKFTNLKKLIDFTLTRADQAMADIKPQQALEDYERILQAYPIPSVAAKMAQAQQQIEQAKELYAQARYVGDKGKFKKALRLLKKVEKLDREAGDLDGRRDLLKTKKKAPRVKRKSGPGLFRRIFRPRRVIVGMILIILVGGVVGARPGLMFLADWTYRTSQNEFIFQKSYSSLNLYKALQILKVEDPIIQERIDDINVRAKNFYLKLGSDAQKSNNLSAAINWYKKALFYDPIDIKLQDLISMLEAKYAVIQSMQK